MFNKKKEESALDSTKEKFVSALEKLPKEVLVNVAVALTPMGDLLEVTQKYRGTKYEVDVLEATMFGAMGSLIGISDRKDNKLKK